MLRPMRAKKTSGPVAMRDLTNCSREGVGRRQEFVWKGGRGGSGRKVDIRRDEIRWKECDGKVEKGRRGV